MFWEFLCFGVLSVGLMAAICLRPRKQSEKQDTTNPV